MVTGFFRAIFHVRSCDFCGHDSLQYAYTPDGGTRGLKVYVCAHCGLTQSAPRIARTRDRHAAAVSGGADWGNVRLWQGLRTRQALEAIARHADLNAALAVPGCRVQSRQLCPRPAGRRAEGGADRAGAG